MGILYDMVMENDFKYMNPPQEPDKNTGKVFHDGKMWVTCRYCGKRQFPIEHDTKIVKLPWKCKGSNCKKELEVNV